MQDDLESAGKAMRRKIAREFRRRINEIRRYRNAHRRGWGSWVICNIAQSAGISPDELRSIVFGTRDPDTLTTGKIARALGLREASAIFKQTD